MASFSTFDLIALAVFLGAWLGYHAFVEWGPTHGATLNGRMEAFRGAWMRAMLTRDVRIVDTQIMASLQNGTAFFASTSLLAIGGALALLRSTNEVFEVFRLLPFAIETTRTAWEAKVLGLAVMFVYAFFKFAWAYRLFNYTAILIGAMPPPQANPDAAALADAARAARLLTLAGRHFNRGQRAFFFALAYLGWFINAWVLFGTTVAVLAVVLRRQYGREAQAVL